LVDRHYNLSMKRGRKDPGQPSGEDVAVGANKKPPVVKKPRDTSPVPPLPSLPVELISLIFSFVTEFRAWRGMLVMCSEMARIFRLHGVEPYAVMMNIKQEGLIPDKPHAFRREAVFQSGLYPMFTDICWRGKRTQIATTKFPGECKKLVNKLNQCLLKHGAVIAGGFVIKSILAQLVRSTLRARWVPSKGPIHPPGAESLSVRELWPSSNVEQLWNVYRHLRNGWDWDRSLHDMVHNPGDVDIYIPDDQYASFYADFVTHIKTFIDAYFGIYVDHILQEKPKFWLHFRSVPPPTSSKDVMAFYHVVGGRREDDVPLIYVGTPPVNPSDLSNPKYDDPSIQITHYSRLCLESKGITRMCLGTINFDLIGVNMRSHGPKAMHRHINDNFDMSFCSTYFDGRMVHYPDHMGALGIFRMEGVVNATVFKEKLKSVFEKHVGLYRNPKYYHALCGMITPCLLWKLHNCTCKRFHKYIKRGFTIVNHDEILSIAEQYIQYEDKDVTVRAVIDDYTQTPQEQFNSPKWAMSAVVYASDGTTALKGGKVRLVHKDEPKTITWRYSICSLGPILHDQKKEKIYVKDSWYHLDFGDEPVRYCPMAGLYIVITRRNWQYHEKEYYKLVRS